MSAHDSPSCSECCDTGLVRSPRWWDEDAEREVCARPRCIAAEELKRTLALDLDLSPRERAS
jgi:hypothetical protein